MSKRYGTVLGGESITFTGTGFSGSAATTVTIDDIACTVSAKTVTDITCTTKEKVYKADDPKLVIKIADMGYVATQGKVFRYVSLWSAAETWDSGVPPQEGAAVNIPKG